MSALFIYDNTFWLFGLFSSFSFLSFGYLEVFNEIRLEKLQFRCLLCIKPQTQTCVSFAFCHNKRQKWLIVINNKLPICALLLESCSFRELFFRVFRS